MLGGIGRYKHLGNRIIISLFLFVSCGLQFMPYSSTVLMIGHSTCFADVNIMVDIALVDWGTRTGSVTIKNLWIRDTIRFRREVGGEAQGVIRGIPAHSSHVRTWGVGFELGRPCTGEPVSMSSLGLKPALFG